MQRMLKKSTTIACAEVSIALILAWVIKYRIMSIKFYSFYIYIYKLLFYCFSSFFLDTRCEVYDVFIDPCPEALDNKPCELPQGINASIIFKYKPSTYKYIFLNPITH